MPPSPMKEAFTEAKTLAPMGLSAPQKVAKASVALQTDAVAHTAAADRRYSHEAASAPAAAKAAGGGEEARAGEEGAGPAPHPYEELVAGMETMDVDALVKLVS